MRTELNLKITVAGDDPDSTLWKIIRGRPGPTVLAQLKSVSGNFSVAVIKIERADGQEIGLDGAFEEYWAEAHQGGEERVGYEKDEAREAFLYGVIYARGKDK